MEFEYVLGMGIIGGDVDVAIVTHFEHDFDEALEAALENVAATFLCGLYCSGNSCFFGGERRGRTVGYCGDLDCIVVDCVGVEEEVTPPRFFKLLLSPSYLKRGKFAIP